MANSHETPNPKPDSRRMEKPYVPNLHNPFAPAEGFTTQIMPDHSVRFVPLLPEQTKPAPETPPDNTQ